MDQILGNISLLFEFPVVNLKIVLDGIMIGALFALAAYGLALAMREDSADDKLASSSRMLMSGRSAHFSLRGPRKTF